MRHSTRLLTVIAACSLVTAGAVSPLTAQQATGPYGVPSDPVQARNGGEDEGPAPVEYLGLGKAITISPVMEDCVIHHPPIADDSVTQALGILSYAQIVERACSMDKASDRLTILPGQDTLGHRTVFGMRIGLPLAPGEADPVAMRKALQDDPVVVKERLADGTIKPWKQTLMVSANIHGTEAEGADQLLAWADYLINADLNAPALPQGPATPTVGAFLGAYDLVLVPTMNPDGRTAGKRRNGSGIDLNRDFMTASQPETQTLQSLLLEYQPVMHLDLHGYYNPNAQRLGLVEPAGIPHHVHMDHERLMGRMTGWVNRLDAQILNHPHIKDLQVTAPHVGVAYKDEPAGQWDDWAPVYTSVWSTLANGAGVTVEAPFLPTNFPVENGVNKAVRGNKAFHQGVINAMVQEAMESKDALLNSLIDYRVQAVLGAPGGASTPWPAGWVIRHPDRQHPAHNQDRLVKRLRDAHIKVEIITQDTALGAVTVRAGDLFVPGRQVHRALAAAMLNPGAKVPTKKTTDVSAWSLGALWGAEVAVLPSDSALPPTKAWAAKTGTSDLATGPWAVLPRSLDQVVAINRLVGMGLDIRRTPEGEVIIPSTVKPAALAIVATLEARTITALPPTLEQVKPIKVGIAVESSHKSWLEQLGYQTDVVDLHLSGTVPDHIDVVVLNRHLSADAARSLGEWVRKGGGLIAIDAGRTTLADMGLGEAKPVGVGARAAGLITARQAADEPVMPNRLGEQVELVEPFQVWTELPTGFRAVQTIPAGTAIQSGIWPDGVTTDKDAALTIAGQVGKGRIIASGAQRLFRHHLLGSTDELFDWIQWVSSPQTSTHHIHTVERIAGDTRVETAIALANKTHPLHSDRVVLTGAQAWADTLVAGPYAHSHNAPILLSNTAGVDPKVVEKLKTLNPKTITVIGGPLAISEAALDQIRAVLPTVTFERLAGATRYETAVAVLRTFPAGTPVIAATGDDAPDALTGGVLAARTGAATVLLPKQASVPTVVRQAMANLGPKQVTVIGGVQAVSDQQANALSRASGGFRRIAGETRYETAVAVANTLTPTKVIGVANGYSTADALLATGWIAQQDGVMLLTQSDNLPSPTRFAIGSLHPSAVYLIGGTSVISQQTANAIAAARGD